MPKKFPRTCPRSQNLKRRQRVKNNRETTKIGDAILKRKS